MKNFNTQYLMVLMMAVMVYAAPSHSTADMLTEIRNEARDLSNDEISLTQGDLLSPVTKIECEEIDSLDTFLCLAEMALRKTHRVLFNKADKLIRQLFQYNLKHTTSCALDTNVESTLKALLDQIETCAKIKILG